MSTYIFFFTCGRINVQLIVESLNQNKNLPIEREIVKKLKNYAQKLHNIMKTIHNLIFRTT